MNVAVHLLGLLDNPDVFTEPQVLKILWCLAMNVPGSYFLADAHVLEVLESMTPSVLLRQDLKLESLVMKNTARLEFWSLTWSSSRYGSVQSDCVMYRFEGSNDAVFNFCCCMSFWASTTKSVLDCGSTSMAISTVMFWCYHCHYRQFLVFWGPLLLFLQLYVCLCFHGN